MHGRIGISDRVTHAITDSNVDATTSDGSGQLHSQRPMNNQSISLSTVATSSPQHSRPPNSPTDPVNDIDAFLRGRFESVQPEGGGGGEIWRTVSTVDVGKCRGEWEGDGVGLEEWGRSDWAEEKTCLKSRCTGF